MTCKSIYFRLPPPLHTLLTYLPYYVASLGQVFIYCITGGVMADQVILILKYICILEIAF